MIKICSKCKDKLVREEDFYKDSTKSDGVNAYCKVCSKDIMNDYYQKNKAKWQKYYKNRKARQKLLIVKAKGINKSV